MARTTHFPRVHLDVLAFLYDNVSDFPAWIRHLTPGQMADLAAVVAKWDNKRAEMEDVVPLESVERQKVTRAISKFNGDVCAAAKALGIGKTTIYRRLKKWGCSTESWHRISQAAALAHKPRVAFQVSRADRSSLHEMSSLARSHKHSPDTEDRHP